jgi:hypothetical protein
MGKFPGAKQLAEKLLPDKGVTTGAEARFDFERLRGAETPLFHIAADLGLGQHAEAAAPS